MPAAWVGLAVAATGALAGGIASSNAAGYQSQVASNNAIIENQNYTAALQAGNANAFDTQLAGAGAAGKLKTNQAANGIDVNTGSAVKVQASQREVQQQNVGTQEANANRTAYGYRVGALSDTAQAQLDEMQSGNDLLGGAFGAAGVLTGGSGKAGGPSLGTLLSS